MRLVCLRDWSFNRINGQVTKISEAAAPNTAEATNAAHSFVCHGSTRGSATMTS